MVVWAGPVGCSRRSTLKGFLLEGEEGEAGQQGGAGQHSHGRAYSAVIVEALSVVGCPGGRTIGFDLDKSQ